MACYLGSNKIAGSSIDLLPIGSEIDYDGDTVPEGWEEVGDPNSYTSEEQLIGTWFGKPLYKKTYVVDSLPNAGSISIPFNIPNLHGVFRMFGSANNGANFFTIPSYRGAVGNGIQIYADINNGITITTESNRTGYKAYITIEYTKTTD